jgi:hypothetical protein
MLSKILHYLHLYTALFSSAISISLFFFAYASDRVGIVYYAFDISILCIQVPNVKAAARMIGWYIALPLLAGRMADPHLQ